MIGVYLMGGLGNQMFQYAAGMVLAEKYNTSLLLDLDWFNQEFDRHTTPRHYELNSFDLSSKSRIMPGGIVGRAVRRIATFSEYNEQFFEYNHNFNRLKNGTLLKGYFQSEKYFCDIRDELLSDFSWAKEAKGKNKELLENISRDASSVSVHVRRGDYVSNESAAKFHGLTGVDYYNAAFKRIKEQIKKPNLYVFSDEPDWCRKNLKFDAPTVYVSHNSDGSEDMRLMKACRHNIIANSSFSWWGAWLNENPDKIVIAPKQWFSHSESNTKDVVPESWQKI